MKNTLFANLVMVLLCSFCFALGKLTNPKRVCFDGLYEGNKLISGMNNHIQIIANQERPILRDDIKVTGEYYEDYLQDTVAKQAIIKLEGDSGNFMIHVNKECYVDFEINTETDVVKKSIFARPLPVFCSFGKLNQNSRQAKQKEFIVQEGVVAYVNCCGFDARCAVDGYDIIRIAADNNIERTNNRGSKLADENLKVIKSAKVGDIYWFRNIKYRCPGTREPQLADDISIEIK